MKNFKENLREHLPKAREKGVIVQVELPLELHADVLKKFEADKKKGIKMTWPALLEAAAKAYTS